MSFLIALGSIIGLGGVIGLVVWYIRHQALSDYIANQNAKERQHAAKQKTIIDAPVTRADTIDELRKHDF